MPVPGTRGYGNDPANQSPCKNSTCLGEGCHSHLPQVPKGCHRSRASRDVENHLSHGAGQDTLVRSRKQGARPACEEVGLQALCDAAVSIVHHHLVNVGVPLDRAQENDPQAWDLDPQALDDLLQLLPVVYPLHVFDGGIAPPRFRYTKNDMFRIWLRLVKPLDPKLHTNIYLTYIYLQS